MTQKDEVKLEGELKLHPLSMEEKDREAVAVERKKKPEHREQPIKPDKQTRADIIKNIVDHLVNVVDINKLLQISPIPRTAIVDIVWDGVQRAILDKERINNRIPLSKIAMEIYLRAVRGSNGMLATALYSMGESQVQGQADANPMQEFNVTSND